jgi:hypothetical protein
MEIIKELVITDITQMPNGNNICVIGVDGFGRSFRPVQQNRGEGLQKAYTLSRVGGSGFYPGVKIRIKLKRITREPPHIEDWLFERGDFRITGRLMNGEFEQAILSNACKSAVAIFENNLINSWVRPGTDTVSVGTLADVRIHLVGIPRLGRYAPRLVFEDSTKVRYDLPISDLAIRSWFWHETKRTSGQKASNELDALLKKSERVHLRIGLTRPYQFETSEVKRCYAQVNAIYTVISPSLSPAAEMLKPVGWNLVLG